jgi:hypothetical protein
MRVTKDLLSRRTLRRASDRRLYLWMAFWFCLAMYLFGCLYGETHDRPIFPFDIRLEGSAHE